MEGHGTPGLDAAVYSLVVARVLLTSSIGMSYYRPDLTCSRSGLLIICSTRTIKLLESAKAMIIIQNRTIHSLIVHSPQLQHT